MQGFLHLLSLMQGVDAHRRHTGYGRGVTAARQGPDGAPPVTFEELVATLQRRQADLSPAHRLLAERVMADPEGVAFMTVSELAAATGVNESTVVRFATGLGLDGYRDLTRLCRDRLRAEAQLLRRFASVRARAAGLPAGGEVAVDLDPLEQAAALDQANVARTLVRVDRATWAAAVEDLATAPRVHVLGLRKCHAVAYLLAYLLRLVRDDVEVLGAGPGTLVDELRRVRPGDCVVGVAIHRYSRATVRAFEWAAGHGATTVALTDNASSPLARHATHTLFAETTSVVVLRSLTAFTSLVQVLASAVAAARGVDAGATLAAEEELLERFEVYD